ncbi:hypothetical protein [Frigoribacterium sp. SL97]|uniref:hypothetical protein n=1 Tax=Frigoribacterium sp. SL97 TaxID=2994664 RepID=UPI002271222E|nr:hypothetical protein [Frigoribacterium sp. SL97]WAC50276.1 hypothetical protein OVA02_10275 [Frigoribacterium sp. SL97]
MTLSSDQLSVIDKTVDALERPVETGRYAESGPNDSFNDGLTTARDAITDALEAQPDPIDAFLVSIPPRITTLAGRGGLREWAKTYRQAEVAAKR